jgi:hypothetical protein
VFTLPNATQAGNLIVVAGQYGVNAGVTLSITDDKGQSYTIAKTNSNTNQTVFIAYFANTVAGVKQITLTYAGANANYNDAWAGEFNNVATSSPVDSSNAASGSSTTPAAGSLTFAASGDLIVQVAEQDSTGAVTGWTAGSQSNITWALADADRGNGALVNQAVQWGVYNSTTTFSPQLTMAPTGGWNTVAVAFKSAAAGSAEPNTVYVKDVNHFNQVSAPSGTAYQATIPAGCNCIVLTLISPHPRDITAISDSHGNTWQKLGEIDDNGNGSGDVAIWAAFNATCSPDMTVTPTVSNTILDGDMVIYGIQSPTNLALDTGFGTSGFVSAFGTQSVAGNLSTVTGTPSTANGIIIAACGCNSPQLRSLVTGNSDITYSPQEASSGDLDENNAKGHYYNPDTSTFTFVWTCGATAVSGWAAAAAAFKLSGALAFPPLLGAKQNPRTNTLLRM